MVLNIFKAVKDSKSDFKAYFDFWISKGASNETHQSLVQCANADVRPVNLDLIFANLPQIKD